MMISFKVNRAVFSVPASSFANVFKYSNNSFTKADMKPLEDSSSSNLIVTTDMSFSVDSKIPPETYVIKFMDILLSLNEPEHLMIDPKNIDVREKFNDIVSLVDDSEKLIFYSSALKFMRTYCRKTGPLKRCLVALKVFIMCELKHHCTVLHWGFQMCYFGTKHILQEKFKEYKELYFAAITVILKLTGLNYQMAPEETERPEQIKVPWNYSSALSHDEIIQVFLSIQVHVTSRKAFKLSDEICDILWPFHKDQLFDRTIRVGHLTDYTFDEMTTSIMQANVHYLEPNQKTAMQNKIMNIHATICQNKYRNFILMQKNE